MKYGIIDIGSNTIRLNLYLVSENKNIVSLLNKKTVAGLSTYINDGQMTKKGADKLVRILKGFLSICEHFDIDNVFMFATAALRNAKNQKQVLEYVENSIGRNIDLLSGEDEASMGYLGIREDFDIKTGYIVDIGGGSIEITIVEGGDITFSTSLTDGHLSLYKQYVERIFPTDKESKNIAKHVRRLLKEYKVPRLSESYPIYGMGGTIRATGNIAMEIFDLPSNSQLQVSTIKKLENKLRKVDPNTMNMSLQVVPERIHTITPGVIVLQEIIKYLNASKVNISSNGAREGYLIRSIEKQNGK